ncbi:MAG: ABC transporter substrate-binding protein [Proteobacteria bacterium]|nr:ABC transporter substrate-binding protein [Pseudomonadota bacterium]
MKRVFVYLILIMYAWTPPGHTASQVVIDDGGRKIKVDKPFSRIISLYGAHTENLMALGLTHEIIGINQGEDERFGLEGKKEFSYHDGPERYLAEKPDLVLIRPMIDRGYSRLFSRLEQSGITVLSFQPGSIDEMYDYWRNLGVLTGKAKQAEAMITNFKASVSEIREKTKTIMPPKRVYFEAMHRQMKTFSKHSMAMFCLATAGGVNIAEDAEPSRGTNIGIYGKERILSHAHEIDVFLVQIGRMNQVDLSTIIDEPGFDIIKAVRENQIYFIDEMLVSRPTPRLIQGVKQIGAALYPEVFKGEYPMSREVAP